MKKLYFFNLKHSKIFFKNQGNSNLINKNNIFLYSFENKKKHFIFPQGSKDNYFYSLSIKKSKINPQKIQSKSNKIITRNFSSKKSSKPFPNSKNKSSTEEDLNEKETKSMLKEMNIADENLTKDLDKTTLLRLSRIFIPMNIILIYSIHILPVFFISGLEILFAYQAFWALLPAGFIINYFTFLHENLPKQYIFYSELLKKQKGKNDNNEPLKTNYDEKFKKKRQRKYASMTFKQLKNAFLYLIFPLSLGSCLCSLMILSELKSDFLFTEYILSEVFSKSHEEVKSAVLTIRSSLILIYPSSWLLLFSLFRNRYSELFFPRTVEIFVIITGFLLSLLFFYRLRKSKALKNKINFYDNKNKSDVAVEANQSQVTEITSENDEVECELRLYKRDLNELKEAKERNPLLYQYFDTMKQKYLFELRLLESFK